MEMIFISPLILQFENRLILQTVEEAIFEAAFNQLEALGFWNNMHYWNMTLLLKARIINI